MPRLPRVVVTRLGLCNRLRVVAALAYVAGQTGHHFTVVWQKDHFTNGDFAEIYQPIAGLTVVARHSGSRDLETIATTPSLIGQLIGARPSPKALKQLYPRVFKPVTPLQQRIDRYCTQHRITECIGLWIRDREHRSYRESVLRSGNVKTRAEHHFLNVPGDFVRLIANGPSSQRYYVATDDRKILDALVRRFGASRILNGSQSWTTNAFRQNTLRDAVFNLHVLSRCARFYGTWRSSYSTTVDQLRSSDKVATQVPLREPSTFGPPPARRPSTPKARATLRGNRLIIQRRR